ncbi:hypothetical protein HNQ92_005277 [Rhabdobacter roseus]|uniref:Uncharacterized protein n=1 Tax=Rhabdobacter roseus TaxID=1655419 RepID=A0A840TW16_9BACT|nr:hypothetical protein [Rhabdobacter roseus]MBB5287115.1 hypothetical protein [Rhabdobacter roseus]
MKVAIKSFRTHQEMDAYQPTRPTIQVRRHLPILLEVIEVDSTDEALIQINLKNMASWYFYTIIRNPDSHAPDQ